MRETVIHTPRTINGWIEQRASKGTTTNNSFMTHVRFDPPTSLPLSSADNRFPARRYDIGGETIEIYRTTSDRFRERNSETEERGLSWDFYGDAGFD